MVDIAQKRDKVLNIIRAEPGVFMKRFIKTSWHKSCGGGVWHPLAETQKTFLDRRVRTFRHDFFCTERYGTDNNKRRSDISRRNKGDSKQSFL